MLTCKEATQLLSEDRDRQLTLGERISLKMHLALCRGCANYRKQLAFLHVACRGYVDRMRVGGPRKE